MSAAGQTNNMLRGAVAGLVGGLIASRVMGFVMILASRWTDGLPAERAQRTDSPTDQQKEGSPTMEVATAAARATGRDLGESRIRAGGQIVHFSFGGLVGAAYGAVAEVTPGVTSGAGIPFGMVVWLGADEIALSTVGLSDPPHQIPPAIHASALAAHLAYGLVTEAVRHVIRRRW